MIQRLDNLSQLIALRLELARIFEQIDRAIGNSLRIGKWNEFRHDIALAGEDIDHRDLPGFHKPPPGEMPEDRVDVIDDDHRDIPRGNVYGGSARFA